MGVNSWISYKTEKALPSQIHGKGWFAILPIKADELLAVKGGHIVTKEQLEQYDHVISHSELQITDDLYLAPIRKDEVEGSMIYANHSCEPNVWFDGSIMVVASRDIQAGEELTIDYGAHFSDPGFRLACNCGSNLCRHVITGNDWQIPELQRKYKGHFAWYIQRKVSNF